MKKNLLEETGIFLFRNGYTVKNIRSCFDILARKDEKILLVKILEDANAVSEEFAKEMLKVSSYVSGSPVIISEKAGIMLKENVVYSRFGVYTLNFETFKNCVNNKFPFVKSTRAGATATIDGRKLKKIREEQGISLGNLSSKLGVSKKMVQKYESNVSELTLNKAFKLYDIFGDKIFNKVNIFSSSHVNPDAHSLYSKKYSALGFEASDLKKVPFDIIAKKDSELILTEVGDNPKSLSLSKLLDAHELVIFKYKKPKDIPALKKEEFLEFESANELIKFLEEFS
jgi:putative transcriptional regulator